MTLRVVGAGLGRTGTHSLKVALEQLLGAPCYHMIEVFGHPDDAQVWQTAFEGGPVDWDALFDGYAATVDWPGGGIWEPIAAAFPDAKVLLSSRASADQWYTSASRTIFARRPSGADAPGGPPMVGMFDAMFGAFGAPLDDAEACKAAYEAHNAHVRDVVPADRLVDWHPEDGWEPLCTALDVPVPDEPFPVTNTSEQFRQMAGLDPT